MAGGEGHKLKTKWLSSRAGARSNEVGGPLGWWGIEEKARGEGGDLDFFYTQMCVLKVLKRIQLRHKLHIRNYSVMQKDKGFKLLKELSFYHN